MTMKSQEKYPLEGESHPPRPEPTTGDFTPALPAGLFDAKSITDELYRVSLTYDTREAFAADVGLSVGYLGQVMNGRMPITGSVAAFFGMRQAQVFEVSELNCPYAAHAKREFTRLSAEYEAAREMLRARLDEDAALLPADVYDARRDAVYARMANARSVVTAHKSKLRGSRYMARTPGEVRTPGETRQKAMTLERVRTLVERGEPMTGQMLRMAHARLKQVLNPRSGTLADSRKLAQALMDRLKLKPPSERPPPPPKAPQSPALKAGQVRRQKQALMTLAMSGRPVPVSDDQPVRLEAALALVEAGMVTKISDEVSRVKGGRMVIGKDTRRTRRVLVIAQNEGERI